MEEAKSVDSSIFDSSSEKCTQLSLEAKMHEVDVGRNTLLDTYEERCTGRKRVATLESRKIVLVF